jgi:hypothetical protein
MLRTREVAAWRETTAAANLDAMLGATSPDNRRAIHALVRGAALLGPARTLPVLKGSLGDLVRTLAASTYYADDAVLRGLGHER